MKIRITDISTNGLHIQDKLSLKKLNDRMNEGSENDIIFTADPQIDLHVTKTLSGGELKGRVTSMVKQPCSRCLEEVEREVTVPISFALKERPPTVNDEEAKFLDDIGVLYYTGDSIEVEEILEEALILSLSPYWAPEHDSKIHQCKEEIKPSKVPSEEKKIHRPFADALKDLKK